MPLLIEPPVPEGSINARPQPVLPAGGDVVLRPWRLTDAAAVVAAYADPDIQRWHARTVADEDEARGMIERWLGGWQRETSAQWAIARRTQRDADGGEALGRMALRTMTFEEGVAECAYWITPAARGGGLAARALRTLSRWAFTEVGFHRLILVHSTRNLPSCRVAQKAGFGAEGVLRSALLHVDGWHDMHLHARIAGDPEPGAGG